MHQDALKVGHEETCVIIDEFALPTGDEADRLLHGLGRVIRLRGADTFVAAPHADWYVD